MMNKYETIAILSTGLTEEQTAGLIGKFKSLIENAGQVEKVEEWGKRRLAYEINDEKDGYYVLINFNADSQLPKELERVYRITDGVLKYIVIRKDK